MTTEQVVDLSAAELAEIAGILRQVVPEAIVRVFGSRATGRARRFSDLDLLVVEPARLDWHQLAELRDRFEASALPFRVDLLEAGALDGAAGERIRRESLPLPLR